MSKPEQSTGVWPVPGAPAEKNWIIVATDRHRCGQPLRALTERGEHNQGEILGRRFARFASEVEAKEWMASHDFCLDKKNWVYTPIESPEKRKS